MSISKHQCDKVKILHRDQFDGPLERPQNNWVVSHHIHGANISQIFHSLEPHISFEPVSFASHSTCPQYLIHTRSETCLNSCISLLISGYNLPLFNWSSNIFWKWNWSDMQYQNILTGKLENERKGGFSNWLFNMGIAAECNDWIMQKLDSIRFWFKRQLSGFNYQIDEHNN